MHNKIGINEYRLRDIEKEIVNLKLSILDDRFTFNENEFNLSYLIKLNNFLFNDFYFDNAKGTRNLEEKEIINIESTLKLITKNCISNPEDIQQTLCLIEKIWNLQPFVVGNTRTMIAFLKVLNEAFLLDLDIDINKEIDSNYDMFKLNNIVNQKRLTMNK